MAEIRACTPEDIPAVAAMFQRTFMDGNKPAPASLAAYLLDLYLRHPWYDPELAPRVYTAAGGSVGGFIGILPLRMTFNGRPVRAALAGSLMVDRPEENPLAGARLLRAFMTGPQDLSLSETANEVSHAMWERLGGETVLLQSMEWLRAFHPAGLAFALLGDRFAPFRLARPLAPLADYLARKIANPFRLEVKPTGFRREADVSDDKLIEIIPELAAAAGYALRPAWDVDYLKWQLGHAAHKHRHGTLHRRAVYGRNDELLGCYLYYGSPRGVSWVLQLLARPDALDPVLDSLLEDAHRRGSVAVRGRVQARHLDALLQRQSVLFRRSSSMAHSADPELMAAIRAGNALTIGLAGESWSRLIGDTFN